MTHGVLGSGHSASLSLSRIARASAISELCDIAMASQTSTFRVKLDVMIKEVAEKSRELSPEVSIDLQNKFLAARDKAAIGVYSHLKYVGDEKLEDDRLNIHRLCLSNLYPANMKLTGNIEFLAQLDQDLAAHFGGVTLATSEGFYQASKSKAFC